MYACGRDEATDGAPNGALGVGSISNVTITLGATAPTNYTPYTGQTNTLTLPETVYGGEVDAVTGDGQETWKIIDLANAKISLFDINQHGIANFLWIQNLTIFIQRQDKRIISQVRCLKTLLYLMMRQKSEL